MNDGAAADLILQNGRITTLDPKHPDATSITIRGGRIVAVDDHASASRGAATTVIDLRGRRVVPGLNDSHMHVIRGGLSYNLELRWDGVPSLADALRMLKEQARRTPPGQWSRVIGGWSEFQFAERRMPTLDEINAVAPDTPVFVLHLYCRALLNKAAVRACGYTRDTPDPPGGEIQRDRSGNPTGLLIARPNAGILYATVGKQPKLPPEHQMNSSRQFMRELNRLGLTSLSDAGGGSQIYPDDYAIIEELHRRGEMTVRMAYNIFTQRPNEEKEDFARCMKLIAPGDGDPFYRCNGAGEMLVYSAADFEDFLEPRPAFAERMEKDLKGVVTLLAANRWPFRIHATYDESIARMLDVFEEVHREIPLTDLRWFFDHCETISDRSAARLSRVEALRLYTEGSSWFSGESGKKGTIAVGQFADLIALTDDYFTVPDDEIRTIESVLTIVDGKVVYGAGEFGEVAPAPLPVLPEWSPVRHFGGYGAPLDAGKVARAVVPTHAHRHPAACRAHAPRGDDFWGLGCDCFAF